MSEMVPLRTEGNSVVSVGEENGQLLEELEAHLLAQVRDMTHQYRWLFHPETFDLEQEDIAQQVRVHFWEVAAIRKISHPKAYVSQMVRNLVIDQARKYEAVLPLPLDAHGELYQGRMIIVSSQRLQDPSQQLEQEESELANIHLLVTFVVRLPRRQREAMLCLLKPLMKDVYILEQELFKVCREEKIDLEKIVWPKDARKSRRLRSALLIARKKLEQFLVEREDELGMVRSLRGMQAYLQQERLWQEEYQRQRKERSRLKRQARKREEEQVEGRRQLVVAFEQMQTQLPELYRTVLYLHYVEGVSFSSIARRSLVPIGTIKARVSRGVHMLHRLRESPLHGQRLDSEEHAGELAEVFVARCQELAEPYQTTVRLRYLEHRRYPEIAQMLGVSVNTIKSRLSRAKTLLQRVQKDGSVV